MPASPPTVRVRSGSFGIPLGVGECFGRIGRDDWLVCSVFLSAVFVRYGGPLLIRLLRFVRTLAACRFAFAALGLATFRFICRLLRGLTGILLTSIAFGRQTPSDRRRVVAGSICRQIYLHYHPTPVRPRI